jgi:hypothetical protein
MLWSTVLVLLWIVANIAANRCWFYVNGVEYVSTMAVIGFLWLSLFGIMRWRGRTALVILTLVIVAVFPPSHRVRIAAAQSTAAGALRRAAQKLDQAAPANIYPASADLETFAVPLTRHFYRVEYVPQYSPGEGKIDGYLLKARPLRYDCGCTSSFIVTSNGKIHVTQEDREATLNDPTLD